MTKEEYLKAYKEDKLAEICERFEKDMNYYNDQLIQCQNDKYKAQKKAEDLSAYWENVDKLFKKLKSLPAEEFIELYSRMKKLIEYPYFTKTETAYLSRYSNDSIATLHA